MQKHINDINSTKSNEKNLLAINLLQRDWEFYIAPFKEQHRFASWGEKNDERKTKLTRVP